MPNTSAYVALNHPIIQIHTGADGAWITLRSSKGKSVSFQPRLGCGHCWTEDSIPGKALQEWLNDRQNEYENQPHQEPDVHPCDHKTLAAMDAFLLETLLSKGWRKGGEVFWTVKDATSAGRTLVKRKIVRAVRVLPVSVGLQPVAEIPEPVASAIPSQAAKVALRVFTQELNSDA